MTTTNTVQKCTYDAARGWVTREHAWGCASRTCSGCKPCTKAGEEHCQARKRCGTHTEGAACPTCIGKIRNNLRAIIDAIALMPVELEETGRLTSAAANHVSGATAHPLSWRARMFHNLTTGGYLEDADQHDPWQMLSIRERMIREALGHDTRTTVSASLSATVDYLTWSLADLAPRHDLAWAAADLLAETNRLRAELETILRDSRTPERGAPCPACPEPEVDGDPRPPRLVRRWAHWCEDDACTREHDTTGARDTWVCPRNAEHWWSEADYRMWVSDDYLANASRLTAKQIEGQYGIKPGTLRKWVERGKVKRAGVDQWGRAMYDVDQVRALSVTAG